MGLCKWYSLYRDRETIVCQQDNERRRLEVEARQDTQHWEQHNRRKAENHRKEENQREEQNQRKMKTKEDKRREEEKDREERQKKAFVSRVRQRSGGVIGLLNNTDRRITFTSTRFLMERSQVQSRLGEK